MGRKILECVSCGEIRQIISRGNCSRCYDKNRNRKSRAKPIHEKAYYPPYSQKSRSLKYKYGITALDYTNMDFNQMGLCDVDGCNRPGTDVDHDHITQQVRSLLCGSCNRALGLLDESIERINGLSDYIKRYL